MYQPLIKFHPHPAIITQVLCIFANMAYVGKVMYVIYFNAWYESD